ncbi:MAG: 2-oxoacid:acceptor oxidoreductase family protein, partial [Spiroplasma sp.]|nr:2-oxoacid:acceptor oxidoreductase family protein [Mycoplasmatales bacterium]
MTYKIVISGFGGQGVLTLGVLLSELALQQNLNVSWIPSYGAEMRGGTANCSVIISDKKIGSPIVNNIDILVAMNNPSIDKFIDSVVEGGKLVINDSIVDKDLSNTEFQVNKISATDIA